MLEPIVAAHHGQLLGAGGEWAPPADGLILYMPMNSDVSKLGTVSDESESGHNGTLVNNAYVAGGRLVCSGSSDGISVAHASALNLQEGTIACWINYRSLSTSYIYALTKGGATFQYSVLLFGPGTTYDPAMWVVTSGGNAAISGGMGQPTLDQWYRFVGTWKAQSSYSGRPSLEIWVGGSLLQKRETTLPALTENSNNVFIGSPQSSRPFVGMMRDVTLHNRQLSTAEIATLFECPTPTQEYPA